MTSTLPRRAVAASALAAVALLGVTACGESKPSTDKIKAAVQKEAGSQITASQIDCLTNAFHKYATAKTLNDYVNGKITSDELKTTDKSKADAAVEACKNA